MISFILPTKNEEKIIATTLSNISKYTGSKEIIVSDGRSTDKTLEIANLYAHTIVVHPGPEKQNISHGKNSGAKKANGEYLVFMDADTFVYEPDKFFTKLIRDFEKNPKIGAITVNIKVFPEFATLGDRLVFGMMNVMNRIYNNVLRTGAATGEFQMIRKEVFREMNGYNEKFAAGEDYDMFRRISKKYITRLEPSLTIYHTGRRAHAIGWPKLLSQWFLNFFSTVFFKRSASKVWHEIR